MAGGSGGLKGKPRAPVVDPDGVRVSDVSKVRRSVWLAALGLVGAAVALLALLRLAGAPQPPQAPAPAAVAVTQAGETPEPAPSPRPLTRPAPEPKPAPPAAAQEPPLPEPPAPPADPPEREDPIVGYGPPGTGIQLFPPPGTVPVLRGIVVPEDFELPEGYVRHHQVTDDGKDLPPILMFHPDYKEWERPGGEPVEIPADRVVPPELAPPGMPIRMLELPGEGAPDAKP
jgi:hypothetical protein